MSALRRGIAAKKLDQMSIKCDVTYADMKFKVRVSQQTTIAQLMIKLRKFIEINDSESLFVFVGNRFYCGNVFLIDIPGADGGLNVTLSKENCFGTLNKGFVKASIKKMKDLYVVCITWSWYHLSHWDEVNVFEDLMEAKTFILKERCAGGLSMDL
jgi:hypothetical protein